ncbi:MAG: HAD family phosphatase [Prolixibacteraceae bacterium]
MIENILFDLGGVLLRIDLQLTIQAFALLGWKEEDENESPEDRLKVFHNLETGDSSDSQFRENIRKMLPGKPTDHDIDCAWNVMLIDFLPGIADFLIKLKSSYHLYLLSNTNAIHLKRFRNIFFEEYGYPLDELFEKTFYSHEIGYRKPNPKAYLKVMEDASIAASHTLFVDDLKVNTDAASLLGMKVLQIEPGTLMQALPEYLGTNR